MTCFYLKLILQEQSHCIYLTGHDNNSARLTVLKDTVLYETGVLKLE